jgi:hypothetical protein
MRHIQTRDQKLDRKGGANMQISEDPKKAHAWIQE